MIKHTERIHWIDVAKGVGILLMLLGHCHNMNINIFIYAFHMPLFFILSGYTIHKIESVNKLLEVIKKYLKFYCIWGGVNLVLEMLLQIYAKGLSVDNAKIFIKYVIGLLYSVPSMDWMPKCTPLWFLTCMICARILFFLLLQANRYKSLLAIVSLLIGVGCSYVPVPVFGSLPWNLNAAFVAVFYMWVGFSLKEANLYDIVRKNTTRNFCLVVIGLCVGLYGAWHNGAVNIASQLFGNNPILTIINSLLIALPILTIAFYLESNRFLEFWGRNSLYFIALNYFVNWTGSYFLGKIIGFNINTNLFACFTANIILISIFIILKNICSRKIMESLHKNLEKVENI